jgi:hypothetical protein
MQIRLRAGVNHDDELRPESCFQAGPQPELRSPAGHAMLDEQGRLGKAPARGPRVFLNDNG